MMTGITHCPRCKGDGWLHYSTGGPIDVCEDCHGTGCESAYTAHAEVAALRAKLSREEASHSMCVLKRDELHEDIDALRAERDDLVATLNARRAEVAESNLLNVQQDKAIKKLMAELEGFSYSSHRQWKRRAKDAEAKVERMTPVVEMALLADEKDADGNEVFSGWDAWGGRKVMDAYRAASDA